MEIGVITSGTRPPRFRVAEPHRTGLHPSGRASGLASTAPPPRGLPTPQSGRHPVRRRGSSRIAARNHRLPCRPKRRFRRIPATRNEPPERRTQPPAHIAVVRLPKPDCKAAGGRLPPLAATPRQCAPLRRDLNQDDGINEDDHSGVQPPQARSAPDCPAIVNVHPRALQTARRDRFRKLKRGRMVHSGLSRL